MHRVELAAAMSIRGNLTRMGGASTLMTPLIA